MVARTMAEALVNLGVSVDVVTTDDSGDGFLAVPLDHAVVENGVTYRYFRRQIDFYTVSWPLSRWLAEHIREYDLVHIHALFSFAATAGAFWASRYRVPYIVRPLGVLNCWGRRNRRPFLKRLSLRLIEQRILAKAALVHFTSEQEKCEAELLTHGIRTVVIPNPIAGLGVSHRARAEYTGPRYPELAGKRVVLFLSRIDSIKGLPLLFNAFANVRAQRGDIVLIVAGNGDLSLVAQLREQAQRMGVEGDVIWAGFVQGEEKRALFGLADVFVLPSYSENFGMAAVEAMANGVPVIVSDQVGIHREIARQRAGLVIKCNSFELEDALRRMLDSPTLRSKASANARLLVEQFAPEVVTARLFREYSNYALTGAA